LVRLYGRYGYRKIAALLRQGGWLVNDKRVERIWRREGLKVPARQPKRARLWTSEGSCIRLRGNCQEFRARRAVQLINPWLL
jgi:putative transposase